MAGRPKMRHCDECRFGEMRGADADVRLCCAHGHQPPFVLPGWAEIQNGEWGWMRRCRDFDAADQAASQSVDPDAAEKAALRAGQQLAWRREGERLQSRNP